MGMSELVFIPVSQFNPICNLSVTSHMIQLGMIHPLKILRSSIKRKENKLNKMRR